MKRILSILFCIIYLTSSGGVNVNFHYCGGKLKDISLTHSDEEDCCGKRMKKDNCCKEKSVVYKVKDTPSQATGVSIVKSENSLALFGIIPQAHSFENNPYFIVLPSLKEPPDIVFSDVYLMNRVFLI